MIEAHSKPRQRGFAYPTIVLLTLLIAGCGDQVVVEGVNTDDDTLVGDSVIDNPAEGAEMAAGEPYAEGNPYEEAEEGEKNMGPNAPGYIPETIY